MKDQILQVYENVIQNYLTPTPLKKSDWLSEFVGGNVYLKLENLNPNGSFKVRGALNAVSAIVKQNQVIGASHPLKVVAASAGNHAQGVAYAAKRLGCEAHIFLPQNASKVKRLATEKLGAKIYPGGNNIEEAFEAARAFCEKENAHFIHPFNDFNIILGQATCALEAHLQLKELTAHKPWNDAHQPPEISDSVHGVTHQLYSSEMEMQQGASERRVYKREAHTQATSNDAASPFPMSIDELNEQNAPDYFICSIGGGGLAAGACLYFNTIGKTKVIGIEQELYNSALRSMQQELLVPMSPINHPSTVADGIAVKMIGTIPFNCMLNSIDQVTSVSEHDIYNAIAKIYQHEDIIVEGAGATAIAGMLKNKEQYKNKTSIVCVSGGNIDPDVFAKALQYSKESL